MLNKKGYDLENRLCQFAVLIIDIAEALPRSGAGNHISGQLIRSGTAPALQYGEAQSAESRRDFIHKMKIALKELRESYNSLRIIQMKRWIQEETVNSALNENYQLIAIFVKSIATAQTNSNASN